MKVLDLQEQQPEFKTPIWDYVDGLIDDDRVADGKAAMATQARALARAEEQIGVSRSSAALANCCATRSAIELSVCSPRSPRSASAARPTEKSASELVLDAEAQLPQCHMVSSIPRSAMRSPLRRKWCIRQCDPSSRQTDLIQRPRYPRTQSRDQRCVHRRARSGVFADGSSKFVTNRSDPEIATDSKLSPRSASVHRCARSVYSPIVPVLKFATNRSDPEIRCR